MSGHTPGPWQIDDWGDDKPDHEMWGNSTLVTSKYRIDRGFHGNDVAYVAPIRLDNRISPEQSANARLIAAAPMLLMTLEAICDELDNDDDFSARQIARHAGRVAIAKAKGEA